MAVFLGTRVRHRRRAGGRWENRWIFAHRCRRTLCTKKIKLSLLKRVGDTGLRREKTVRSRQFRSEIGKSDTSRYSAVDPARSYIILLL